MKLVLWLGGVLLLLLVLLVLLPFSATGTRFMVHMIDGLEPVSIEYRGGSLFGDLELSRLHLDLPGVQLELTELQTRLELECFWTSRFCLTRADVGDLAINLVAGTDTAEPEQPGSSELIEFPYPVQIEALEVGSVSVTWQGGQWRQARLVAGVDIQSSRIQVKRALVEGAELQLDPQEEEGGAYEGFVPPALFLPLVLQVDSLDLQGGRFVRGEQRVELDSLQFSARWRGSLLEVLSLTAVVPGWGRADLGGALHFEDAWPVDVQGRIAAAPGRVPVPLDERLWTLSLAGDLDALGVEVLAAGAPELTLQGELAVSRPGLPFESGVTLTWPEPVALADLLPDSGMPPDLRLSAPLRASASGDLTSQSVRFDTVLQGLGYEALEVRGEGRWQAPRLVISDLQVRDAASSSELAGSADILLATDWRVVARVDSGGLQLPALTPAVAGRITGGMAVSGQGSGDTWAIAVSEIDLSGDVNTLPASLRGSVGLDHSLRLLPGQLEGDVNGTRLSLRAAEGERDARLYLALDSLGRWLPDAAGAVTLEARGDLRGAGASLEGRIENLRYAGMDLPLATVSADWRGDTQKLDAHLAVPELLLDGPGLALEKVRLTLAGTPDAHQLQLQSAGDVAGELVVDGSLARGDWRGVLQPTQLATRAERWQLDQAVAISWDGAAASAEVAPHCWRHEQFELCGSRLVAGRRGDLQLRLAGDVRAFNGLLPRSLRINGPLQASLAAEWGGESPLTLAVDGGAERINVVRRYGMGDRVKVTWESGRFRLRHDNNETRLAARVNRDGRTVIDIDAILPAEREGALSGRVALDRLQLGTLAPWVTELSTLGGELSGALRLAGTVDDPLFSGELSLQDGHVVVVGNPTELTELALNLSLHDNRGTLSGRGLLGGGQVTLDGDILTQPALRVTMQVRGTRHQVLVPPASELVVSEELQLVLTGDLLDATGWVRIHEGVLRHEELPEGGVSMSRDVVIVDVTGQVVSEERPFEIRSDIVLRIDNRFRVEGEQINATLGGDLQLVRELGRPLQVFGTLQLLGGELNAYKQRLQIKRGTIAFSGPPDNPELNIGAEREIRADNVTVGARLYGRLEEPELEIYSNPVMSQSEAMSYLVRGRPLDSGSGADGTALALSLGADAVNQSGIVRELNRLPLISNVAFGSTGEADDTAATVSGYIGERIYLSYGIGIYEPINVLTARLYLQSRLWLEVVSRLENSVDLYYAFEIE